MAQAPIQTDLILQVEVAKKPVTLVGSFEDGKLAELSGCVNLDANLSSVLDDLGENFQSLSAVLKQLVGGDDIVLEKDDIVLEKLGVAYRSASALPAGKTGGTVQIGLIVKVGDNRAQFALLKGTGSQEGFIVGVELQADMVVPKNLLSGIIGDISIRNLGVYYSSEAFKDVMLFGADGFQDATPLLPPLISKTSQNSTRTFSKGVKVSADLFVGGVNLLELLEKVQTAETPASIEPPAPASANLDEDKIAKDALSQSSTYWYEAKKTIGPLTIRRIGLSYEAPRVGIKLDAGLQLSVLTLALEGLGLSYPIDRFSTEPKEIWDNLEFQLDGAAVSFSAGPLTIGGGLLRVKEPSPPVLLQLDGFLLIRTSIFTISALGSYADMNGTASLFVFAALQKELGGPACFFVTGLAVGFGINRALKLPTIQEVQNFPLIKAATDSKYLAENSDLRVMSAKIGEYIYPLQGNFWIAAGVKFTSFGFVQAFVMVSVSFGTQFEIALLGLAKITVPMQLPGDVPVPVIACAELAIKASCNIGSGLLAIEARLTSNSFIFTQECRLTGGFAFFVWFAGEHEGDFVVTLGGYHAKFVKPAHYPVVPRLGIRWQLSTVLSITGEAYFALTPSCLMAGGKLDIVFQAGPVSAWFYVHADFLIAWKPLYYDIDVGVRIGVALNLGLFTLTVELAAAVHLWGPPFGGIAHVSWYFISFDIPFGDQVPGKPDALTWEQFHQAFLPQSKEGKDPLISTIRITGGLISEKEIGVGTDKQMLRQVNAHQLSFVTEALIPSTKVIFNEVTVLQEPSKLLGIRPMGQTSLDSTHKVTLRDKKENRVQIDVDLKTVTKNVPCALWSKDTSRLTMSGAAAMTIKAQVGLQVSLKTPEPTHPLAPIDLQKFAYDEIKKSIPWVEIQVPKEIAAYPADEADEADEALGQMEILMNTILRDTVKQKRLAILAALGKSEEEIEAIALAHLAQDAQRIFQAAPEMAGLGEPLKPPKSY